MKPLPAGWEDLHYDAVFQAASIPKLMISHPDGGRERLNVKKKKLPVQEAQIDNLHITTLKGRRCDGGCEQRVALESNAWNRA